ncbi:hypothetical protein PFAG_02906 [Plasmodium falciparum Santa Lucia]|uniref:DUF4110 domain-containing protein n=3 Tax=Plasmodium falciparum TaxID=5833 RepID=A0A0L7KKV0_PLAFX|nr:hypothetical protein PFFVO_02916 [Plasmodium falciparum Vietnam Oak-Knoll (FVO)]EUT85545.1 hypothetical protein PFAG_02906 [Plasmodium falciparum Santa Lucia]KOB63730.1 hypothetical protein PFHG_04114 [Plasmodium falciparum HB3]
MVKKDKKSKEKKEKLKLKKEKQKLKSLKSKKKKKDTLSDEDFDTICLYYENLNKKDKFGHININTTSNNTFVECEKPSPRSNCSITFINDEEFILFGGEYNDNNELISYNDLFKYNIVKNKWKYYFTTSKKPKPRCSHQTVYFNKKLYIFGGELCTNTQFFHYNDFWSFDLKNNVFEEIETKNKKDDNKPSPRSGHRMILWKNYIVMFGGFFDNGKSIEYFNDLYIYIINSNIWINLTNVYMDSLFKRLTENNSSNNDNNLSISSEKKKDLNKGKNSQILKSKFFKNFDLDSFMPSKRSSVCLFTDMKYQKIYIYGGYSQIKNTTRNAIGFYFNDMWILNINLINEDNISVNFKKLKKSIFQPCKRTGFSTCIYKNSLILFGGVFDKKVENNSKKIDNPNNNNNMLEESLNLKSLFFNDLYLFDMNKEHWSYLNIKDKEETKELNKTSKANKKNHEKLEENKIGTNIKKDKFQQMEREIYYEENNNNNNNNNNKTQSKYEETSDGHVSSCFSDDNDEDYYSNVFVYFDENGKRQIIKIEKEEKNKSSYNEKKDFDDVLKVEENNDYLNHSLDEEKNINIDKLIDNHSVFLQTKDIITTGNGNKVTKIFGDENKHCQNISNLPLNETILYVPLNNTTNSENFMYSQELNDSTNMIKVEHINDTENVDEETCKEDSVDEDMKDNSNSDSDSNKEEKKKKFVISEEEPIGRINSHIFVLNKNLYVYGGMYEYKNNEIILSDYWKINIFKREKWELLDKGNLDDIYLEESDMSSTISINDDDKDEKEIEDLIICSKIKKLEKKIKELDEGLALDIKENLNEFFLRTKDHWLKELNKISETKEIRKEAFYLCEQKYKVIKKYYNKIQKYKELLMEDDEERSISETISSEQEQSSN